MKALCERERGVVLGWNEVGMKWRLLPSFAIFPTLKYVSVQDCVVFFICAHLLCFFPLCLLLVCKRIKDPLMQFVGDTDRGCGCMMYHYATVNPRNLSYRLWFLIHRSFSLFLSLRPARYSTRDNTFFYSTLLISKSLNKDLLVEVLGRPWGGVVLGQLWL